MTETRPVSIGPVQAVLFDMDGTLIDSGAAIARSWTRWAGRWNVSLDRPAAHGRPARSIVQDLVAAADVDRAFADVEALEIADTGGVVVLPGVTALLEALPADRWAIVTSCSAPLAAARLAAVGLAPPVLVTASDTARGKPDPDPFLAAAARLGVDPADCLVVEDAPAGVQAGRAAGCLTLAVEGTVAPDLLSAADATVRSLAGIRVEVAGGIRLVLP